MEIKMTTADFDVQMSEVSRKIKTEGYKVQTITDIYDGKKLLIGVQITIDNNAIETDEFMEIIFDCIAQSGLVFVDDVWDDVDSAGDKIFTFQCPLWDNVCVC